MKTSRLNAVENIEIEAPRGVEDSLRWFYADLGGLSEVPSGATEQGTLCFRSARIELRIRTCSKAVSSEIDRRLTLAVPSLRVARQKLEETRHAFAVLSGIGVTDRRIRTRDPAGNVVELKQEWPDAPL